MGILEFIFQSFWHWIGTIMIIGVATNITSGIVRIENVAKEKKDEYRED